MQKVLSCSLRVLILRLFSKLKLHKTGGRKHFHCHPNSTCLYCLKGAARKSEGWRSQVTSFSGWAQTEEDRKVTGSDCRFITVFKVVIVGNFLVKWTTAIIPPPPPEHESHQKWTDDCWRHWNFVSFFIYLLCSLYGIIHWFRPLQLLLPCVQSCHRATVY